MSRLNALKPTIVLGIALVALGLAAAGPSSSSSPSSAAAVSPAPLATPAVPAACQETLFSTAPTPGASFEPLAPGGCKPCKNLPQCGCTYQGHPRISCDPCCYSAFPYPICLS